MYHSLFLARAYLFSSNGTVKSNVTSCLHLLVVPVKLFRQLELAISLMPEGRVQFPQEGLPLSSSFLVDTVLHTVFHYLIVAGTEL